jgi:hypothetical protein
MKLSTYSSLAVMVAVAIGAIGWLGLAGWIAVVVIVASVGMHVAGNAIGTRLRNEADRTLADRGSSHAYGGSAQAYGGWIRSAMPHQRPGRLEKTESLGRLVPVSAVIGGAIGGASGATALALVVKSSLAGAVLGGVSSAVIGGLLGFLGASFVEIIRTSLGDAIRAENASRAAGTGGVVASKPRNDLVP